MIPGNTERGRRWRRNEDALPLLGNKLAVKILGALFERLPLKAPAIANSTTK